MYTKLKNSSLAKKCNVAWHANRFTQHSVGASSRHTISDSHDCKSKDKEGKESRETSSRIWRYAYE